MNDEEDGRKSRRGCPQWLTYLLGLTTVIFLVLTIVFAVKMNDKDTETITVSGPPSPAVINRPDDGRTTGLHPVFDPFADVASRKLTLSPKAEAIFSNLSFAHKAGQLVQWARIGFNGTVYEDDTEEDWIKRVETGKVGSMLNLINPKMCNKLQEAAVALNGVPILLGFDVIHGHRTIGPVNLGMASAFSPELVENFTRDCAAAEAAADGVRWSFAPMLDVSHDPRWGRMSESSGEDPYLGGVLGAATVRGFQSNKGKPVAACAKHVAAYGAVQNGKDYTLADGSWNNFHNNFFEPYLAAAKAGVLTAMGAYQTVNGIPAHASREIQTDILRGLWGFQGLLVSDYLGVPELKAHGVAANSTDSSLMALHAGVDMDMGGEEYIATLDAQEHTLYPDGHSVAEYVDLAARRVIWVKDQLGLFEDGGLVDETDDDKLWETVYATPEKLALAQIAAEQSAVLLKNSGNTLPIDFATAGKTLLVGKIAADPQAQIGSWSGLGGRFPRLIAMIKTVLIAANERFKCSLSAEKPTDPDCTAFDYYPGYAGQVNPDPVQDEAMATTVVEAIRDKEYGNVIVVLGENELQSGEGASRVYLELPHYQSSLIRRITEAVKLKPLATRPKVTLVLMIGRPNIIQWESENVDAILLTWNSGMMGGIATWNLLAGDVIPSGKLPITFPRAVGQIPIHYSHLSSGRPVPSQNDTQPYEGETNPYHRYTSRYIDEYSTALYDFGYGLSYNTYTYAAPVVSPTTVSATDLTKPITIRVHVTRGGSTTKPSAEIVQVYIKQHLGVLSPARKRLRAFKRLEFDVGQTEMTAELTLTLDEDFAQYNAQVKRTVEPGRYTIFVARDSSDETHPVNFSVIP